MNAGDDWKNIDVETIIVLHRDAILRYGGSAAPPKPGCLDACVGTATNNAMYSNNGDGLDLLVVAAYLLKMLALNHCFIDGNKRVAWSALIRLLGINNVSLDYGQ